MKLKILLALLLLLIFPLGGQSEKYSDFQARYRLKIDESSMRTCWVAFGQIEQVKTGTDNQGFKCTTKEQVWTANDKQAMDYCKSKFPYHILAAKSLSSGGNPETTCVFQINLKCDATNFWQIHGKCYKVIPGEHTFAESQSSCSSDKLGVPPELNPKVADFSASNFNLYLEQMVELTDAWVTVPNLKDYFENGEGHAAVYVQEGGFMYDMKEGSIMMDSFNAKHQILCQYDAPKTSAEILYLAKVYSEIYPMKFVNDSIVIATSSYMTLKQKGHANGNEAYTTENFVKACDGIGNILEAFSYPTVATGAFYGDLKNQPHKFVLLSAYKNKGCQAYGDYKVPISDGAEWVFEQDGKTDYCDARTLVFHKSAGMPPAKAAMRAPVLCSIQQYSYEYGDCPDKPAWADAVVEFDRGHTKVCHYIHKKEHTLEEAERMCREGGFNAALSGFDSAEEFDKVRAELKSKTYDHYWLGGEVPCRYDCEGDRLASWKEGVATNNAYLNERKHSDYYWRKNVGYTIVSFQQDYNEFHAQFLVDYTHMRHICQRSAKLIVRKWAKGQKVLNANIL